MTFRKCIIAGILVALTGALNPWTEAVPLSINFGKLDQKFRTPHFYVGSSHYHSSRNDARAWPLKSFTLRPYICPEGGLHAHPEQDVQNRYILCVKFHQKGRWYGYIYQCPDGSYFNKKDKVCHLGSAPPTTTDDCDRQRRKRSMGLRDDSDEDIICS